MPLGSSRKCWMGQVTAVASSMTKTTAMDMPEAWSSFLETPRNGQMPRKRCST